MQFSEFCKVLTAAFETRKKQQKTAYIAKLIKEYIETGGDLFQFMRLLVPFIDNTTCQLGIKDSVLGRLFVDILGLSKESTDYRRLILWRNYAVSRTEKTGDFAAVLRSVLSERSTNAGGELNLKQIGELLDRLAVASTGTLKNSQRREVLVDAYQKMSADEIKWFVRIILKDLRLGMTPDTILKLYHPAANQVYLLNGNLKELLEIPYSELYERVQLGIKLFNPFKPMLCKYTKPHIVPQLMKDQEFWMETKFDGERIMIHYESGKFKYFTRNQNDYTDKYGQDASKGALSPFIFTCFNQGVESCVLDGEMLVWNAITRAIRPFGELRTAELDALTNGKNAILRPFYVAFDCVYLNGKSLLHCALHERFEIMNRIITVQEKVLEISQHKIGKSVKDMIEEFSELLCNQQEGMIVKNPKGIYHLDTRCDDFLKLKADSLVTTGETLDLVVVGAFWGSGSRKGKLGSFMMAVYDETIKKWLSFGKMGSGFSQIQIDTLTRTKEPYFKEFDKSNCPEWLVHPSNGENPDLIIEPKDSIVVTLGCFEIIESEVYGSKLAPRFPRFKGIRADKTWKEATTLKQLQDFVELNKGKSHKLVLNYDEYMQKEAEKKPAKKPKMQINVASQYLPPSDSLPKEGELFLNIQFSVIAGTLEGMEKHQLEQVILANGGSISQNPVRNSTKYVIADKNSEFLFNNSSQDKKSSKNWEF